MKALKEIKTYEEFDCKIKEVTLLSIEEYKKYRHIIPLLRKKWWLRSPGYRQIYAAFVYIDGAVGEYGDIVYNDYFAVRPALKIQISNLESFKPGDKLESLDRKWTVLDVFEDSLYILCNESIGDHRFNEISNVWETSELKEWLEAKYFG